MRRIWRLLLYVRPYALYSLASVVLMAVVGAMAAFRILLVKPIFDNVLTPDAPPGLVLLFRIPHTDHVINLQRFLPNPHFVPEFRKLTGKDPKVARYVLQFPQTREFLDKTTEMLKFLLPHYIQEGKSYLTVAFGCTGGQHRSVFIAEEMKKRLAEEGYRVKTSHRDMPR